MTKDKRVEDGDDDVAVAVLNELPDTIDENIERRLKWKIDLILMPLMFIAYGLQYYDKAIFGNAAVFGLLSDMNLTSSKYSTATAAFYWGYIVACFPMSYLLTKLPLARTLAIFVLLWGAMTFVTIGVHSYLIVLQRVFLGIVESAVSPGFVLLCSQWYKKSEQPLRIAIWYSSTGIFQIFSGVLNYGIGKRAETSSLSPWKAMYITGGSVTIFFSIILFIFLPESPLKSRLLNKEERLVAVARLKDDHIGVESKEYKWDQVIEAIKDVKIYAFFILAVAIYMVNGPVTAFGSQVIKSFGYSSLKSILMGTPGGATTAVSIWVSAFIAGKCKNKRLMLLMITCLPVIVGSCIIWKGSWQGRGLPLFGYYLLPIFGAPYVMMLATNTSNIAGSTKKSISAAAIFVGYNVGNIASPYLVDTTTSNDHYPKAWIGVLVSMVIAILTSLFLLVYLRYENKRRDKLYPLEEQSEDNEKLLFGDLTDIQNKYFRYSY